MNRIIEEMSRWNSSVNMEVYSCFIMGCYELLFDFGHFRIWSYVKCPYLSPNYFDPRGQNKKLTAKRIFDFLIIENF